MPQCDRFGWRDAAACALTPVLIVVALGARQLPGVFAGGLINPDSYMRLVRLQETLHAHHPAYIVTADGSGQGTLLHWSHLLDSLLCLLAAPFGLLFDSATSLHAAAMLAGPLSLAALGYAIGWTAAPFAGRRLIWLGPILAALSPAIGSYGLPGVVHHHIPIVVATVMAGGWATRIIMGIAPPRAGWRLGAWAGVAVWLTPEVTPLLALIFGGLGLAWLTMPERGDIGRGLRATGVAFLLVVTAAFAVDPPYAGYGAVEIDRLSILFVGLAGVTACTALGTLVIDRAGLPLPPRIFAIGALAAACGAVWLAAFPVVLRGSDNMLSAADWHAMFDHISEMRPVTTLANAGRFLLTGTLATALLIWLATRQRSLPLAYVALCAAALVALGQMHVRFAAYPATLAAIMLPIAIAQAEHHMAARPELSRAMARLAVIGLFVLAPYAGGLPHLFKEAQASEAGHEKSCAVSGLTGMLAPYAGMVVLSNVNDAPELLYRTQVETVGSLYHRNVAGFLRLRAAWRSLPSDTVPQAVQAADAALVLFCPSAKRSPLVSDLPPDTLLDRLNRHDVPGWLQLVAADSASGNMLYRIVR